MEKTLESFSSTVSYCGLRSIWELLCEQQSTEEQEFKKGDLQVHTAAVWEKENGSLAEAGEQVALLLMC